MAIIAGYIKQTDGSFVEIGSYDNAQLAEAAIAADTSTGVKEYCIASSVDDSNGEPDTLGTIDV